MYRPSGPPQIPSHSRDDEYDQYPLNDTNFVEQRPAMQSPFADPYSASVEQNYTIEQHGPPMPSYDTSNQPLLDSNQLPPMPQPFSENRYPESPPPPLGLNIESEVPPFYFTGAPRRQPRRYKTSKLINILKKIAYSIYLFFFSQKS
jgi:chitin synthase